MPVVFETRCKCGRIFSSTKEWAQHYVHQSVAWGLPRNQQAFICGCGFGGGGQKWIEGQGERRFHKSSYWGCWSRVLEAGWDFVEVNLTALRGWSEDVEPIVIRLHGTARTRDDVDTAELPPQVVQEMVANLPPETVGLLLGDGLRDLIDFDKLKRITRSGGVPLAEVRKA